jgi:hypothetical protein
VVVPFILQEKEVLGAVQAKATKSRDSQTKVLHNPHNLQVMQLQQQQRTSDAGSAESSLAPMAGMVGMRNNNKVHVGSGSVSDRGSGSALEVGQGGPKRSPGNSRQLPTVAF